MTTEHPKPKTRNPTPGPGYRGVLVHVQADGAHEVQGIAFLDHPRAQLVVEHEPALFQMIFKVGIDGAAPELVRDFRNWQIVRCGYG
jgi:hypothetical protein